MLKVNNSDTRITPTGCCCGPGRINLMVGAHNSFAQNLLNLLLLMKTKYGKLLSIGLYRKITKSLPGGKLLLTTKSPGNPDTYLLNLTYFNPER